MKEENKAEKDKRTEKNTKKEDDKEVTSEETEVTKKKETEGEKKPTFDVSRGVDNVSVRQDLPALPINLKVDHVDMSSMSLEPVQMVAGSGDDPPIVTQLSHQLCEQLRLVLEPTRAA